MQQLSAAFHAKVDLPAFLRDLKTNDGAILVRDRETNEIGGFIALKKIPLSDGPRQANGIVSGDVIMDPSFGGERALKDAVTRHFLSLWLTARGVPLYWLLLLKTCQRQPLSEDSFLNDEAGPDGQIEPALQHLIRQYAEKLLPGRYDERRGTLDFSNGPGWRTGHYLPCLAEISTRLLQPYLIEERRKIQNRRRATGSQRLSC
jgi:hypothetical protein